MISWFQPAIRNSRGHPRGAGTYARVLGKHVREDRALSLMDALRKSSLMPAQRLEVMSPRMRQKGRVKFGADADFSMFDPVRVIDKATFANPAQYSTRRSGLMLTSTERQRGQSRRSEREVYRTRKALQPSYPELADQRAETQAGLPRRAQSSHLRQCRTLRRCLRSVLPDDDQESRICITILIEANRVASVRVTVRTIAEEDQP
jgi:hypothetical protein